MEDTAGEITGEIQTQTLRDSRVDTQREHAHAPAGEAEGRDSANLREKQRDPKNKDLEKLLGHKHWGESRGPQEENTTGQLPGAEAAPSLQGD